MSSGTTAWCTWSFFLCTLLGFALSIRCPVDYTRASYVFAEWTECTDLQNKEKLCSDCLCQLFIPLVGQGLNPNLVDWNMEKGKSNIFHSCVLPNLVNLYAQGFELQDLENMLGPNGCSNFTKPPCLDIAYALERNDTLWEPTAEFFEEYFIPYRYVNVTELELEQQAEEDMERAYMAEDDTDVEYTEEELEEKRLRARIEQQIEIILTLDAMSPSQLHAVFYARGQTSVVTAGDNETCNVFGGLKDCVDMEYPRQFEKACPFLDYPLKRDCGYATSTEGQLIGAQKVDQSPEQLYRYAWTQYQRDKMSFEANVQWQGHDKCPECSHNLDHFLCAVSHLPCGLVRAQEFATVKAARAAVKEIVQNEVNVNTEQVKLAGAIMPQTIDVLKIGMPCKRMCKAIVNTCGGGYEYTLQDLVYRISFMEGEVTELPTLMFEKVMDVPLCDIFMNPEDATEEFPFVGPCYDDVIIPNATCPWNFDERQTADAQALIFTRYAQRLFKFYESTAKAFLTTFNYDAWTRSTMQCIGIFYDDPGAYFYPTEVHDLYQWDDLRRQSGQEYLMLNRKDGEDAKAAAPSGPSPLLAGVAAALAALALLL